MDKEQFKELMKELSDIKILLMLNASKSGANSDEIAKCLGAGGSTIRKLLAGTGKKKGDKDG